MKFSKLQEVALEAVDDNNVADVFDYLQILNQNKATLEKNSKYDNLVEVLVTFLADKKVDNDSPSPIYDFSKYELIKTDWRDLWNKDKYKTFPLFVRDYLLPTFHRCPDMEVQHPIMACFALFNSAALPDAVKKPNAICTGQSRTGKSQYATRCMQMVKRKHTTTIKASFSPLATTQAIHRNCYISGDNTDSLVTAPSVIRFDNIYIKEFISRLGDHYVTLLALEKSDAINVIGGKDGGTYFPWAKYIFTTVDVPYRDNDKMSELLNRTLVFYFGKGFDPSLDSDNYGWSSMCDTYSELWSKEEVEEVFFPLLVKTGKVDKKKLQMLPTEYDISRVLIATGVYCGLFDSIDDGIEAFELYWEMLNKRTSNVGNLMYKIVDTYLEKYYRPEINTLMATEGIKRDAATRLATIPLQHIRQFISSQSDGVISLNSEKKVEELEGILSQHDLVSTNMQGSIYFLHRQAGS